MKKTLKFTSDYEPMIMSGDKIKSIENTDNGLKPGKLVDFINIDCYGEIFKSDVLITMNNPIEIDKNGYSLFGIGTFTDDETLENFANQNGFDSWSELIKVFKLPFNGWLVCWNN